MKVKVKFIKIKVTMFQRKITQHQKQPILLTEPQASYKKLEKEMNKPPSEYEAIKNL